MCLGLVWIWTAGAADVWINELVADPAGADAGQEWVELWSSADVVVGGWRLEAATRPGTWTVVAELPPDAALRAGGYLVVADVGATVDDAVAVRLVFSSALGNAGTDADAVRLVDGEGRVVDVLAYGADAAGLFPEATAHADKPATDEAVARMPDGARHAEDAESTPGQPNPTPTRCVPGLPGSVRLTEAQPDPDGADAGQEWVELVVRTGRDLAGWSIEQASTPEDWGRRVRFTFPQGTIVAAGDRVLVADPDADLVTDWRLAPGDTLGLGNGADAVRLVDCGGRPIDTLLYGDENLDGFEEDDGVVPLDAAPSPTSGGCLARLAEDEDQDRSALDWAGLGRCTPGAPNAEAAPPITEEDPVVSGCTATGRPGRPGGGRPGGGCATGLGSLGWAAVGAALITRRRAGRGRAR